jgi:fucose permease
MYPIAMTHASRVLPPWLVTSAIGWISGIGVSGAAIMPFVAGAIADQTGFLSLIPLYVIFCHSIELKCLIVL